MHDLAKTLLLFPSLEKWGDFYDTARAPLRGIYEPFDNLIDFIDQFHREHKMVPDARAIRHELQNSRDTNLLAYVDTLLQDVSVPTYPEDMQFAVAINQAKQQQIIGLATSAFQEWQSGVSTDRGRNGEKLQGSLVELVGSLNQVALRLRQGEMAEAVRMHGSEAYHRMWNDYHSVEAKALAGEATCYRLPWSYFSDVEIVPGDLITLWGYTSQCKSVLAREIAYDLIVREGMNVEMITTEMPAKDVEKLFAVRHANNKKLFKGTPKIPFKTFKNGAMTPEQKDFFFDVAFKDFLDKDHYGTLQVESLSPGFNLGDLADRCASIERHVMPVEVVLVDYLAQINPLAHGARSRGDNRADVNRMFAEFRQFGLEYRRGGVEAPLILITPAQISRGKYVEAIKNEKIYDITAASDFNEIERSSSIVLTTLMDLQMKDEGRLRIQCLKNRMGAVPGAPYELYVALANGGGIDAYEEPDEDDFADRLAELQDLRYLEVAA